MRAQPPGWSQALRPAHIQLPRTLQGTLCPAFPRFGIRSRGTSARSLQEWLIQLVAYICYRKRGSKRRGRGNEGRRCWIATNSGGNRTGDRSDHTQNRVSILAQFWVWWRMVQGGSGKRKPTTTHNQVFMLNFGGGDAGGSKRKSTTPELSICAWFQKWWASPLLLPLPPSKSSTTDTQFRGSWWSSSCCCHYYHPWNQVPVLDWNGRCAVASCDDQ